MENKRRPARVCGVIGLALFCMMLAWYGGNILLSLAHAYFWPASYDNVWFVWLRNDLPLYLLGAPVFLLLLRLVPNGPKTPRPETSMRLDTGKFMLVVLFCFGATYVLNMVSLMLTGLVEIFSRVPAASSTLVDLAMGGVWPSLIFGVVVPALGEEFLFRRVIHQKMRGASDASYIFISALSFSLFHANLSQMLYTFVLGATFAWLYALTRNIWLPVLLHFLINAVGILLAPALAQNVAALAIYGLLMLLLMAAAIVFFIVFRKPVFATLQPPAEAGWPYRTPKWLAAFLWQQQYKQQMKQAGGTGPAPMWWGPPYCAPPYAAPPGVPHAPPVPYAPQAPPPIYTAPPQCPPPMPQLVPYDQRHQTPYYQPAAYYTPDAAPQPVCPPPAPWPPYRPPMQFAPGPYVYSPVPARPAVGCAPYYPAAVFPAKKPPGPLGVCVRNVGMILYTTLAGVLTLWTLYVTVWGFP